MRKMTSAINIGNVYAFIRKVHFFLHFFNLQYNMKITRKSWLEGHMRSCFFFDMTSESVGDALFSAEICVCSRRNTVRIATRVSEKD